MTEQGDQAGAPAGDGSLTSRLRTLLARLDAAAVGEPGTGDGDDRAGTGPGAAAGTAGTTPATPAAGEATPADPATVPGNGEVLHRGGGAAVAAGSDDGREVRDVPAGPDDRAVPDEGGGPLPAVDAAATSEIERDAVVAPDGGGPAPVAGPPGERDLLDAGPASGVASPGPVAEPPGDGDRPDPRPASDEAAPAAALGGGSPGSVAEPPGEGGRSDAGPASDEAAPGPTGQAPPEAEPGLSPAAPDAAAGSATSGRGEAGAAPTDDAGHEPVAPTGTPPPVDRTPAPSAPAPGAEAGVGPPAPSACAPDGDAGVERPAATEPGLDRDLTAAPAARAEPAAAEPAAATPVRMRRRFGRIRAAVFGTTLAVLVAAIPVLTWLGVETISDSSQGQVIEPETDASAPGFEALVEPTPTLLLAHASEDGGLAGLTVLGLGFGDEGGDVLFVPVGTLADIPSVGVDRLAVAFDRGGLDLVRESTESLLDVRFTEAVLVDAARWAALVEPVAPLSVTNPDPVVVVDDGGSATVAFPAGNIDVAADEVSALLATRSTDETQLARLVRHQAFWEAWLGAVGSAPSGNTLPGEVATGIGRFVRGLAAGDVVYETLRVASGAATPDGDEAYEVDPDAVATQISELLPFAAAPEGGDRARVRVLNGTGDPALTPIVTRVLVPAGAAITVIGNADRFDYDRTQVVYYDQAEAEVAERLRDAMGVGEVVLSNVPNDSVDVTVVVGSDFALPAATEGGQDGGSDSTG